MSIIEVDASIYSHHALNASLYKFTGYASFSVNTEDDVHSVNISVFPESELSESEIVGLINNELIDQSLREKIKAETEIERNLILSYVFSNTDIHDNNAS